MQKRLLVTVSEDQSALMGVRFVRDFFVRRESLNLTLFYTAARPRAVWVEEDFFQAMDEYDQAVREQARIGREALEGAAALLAEAGFSPQQLNTRLRMPETSTLRDLLREGDQSRYEAMVLGRRGAGQLQEMVTGGPAFSLTDRLVDRGMTVPLWICREPEPGRSGLLLCLDGAPSCMAMAEHVGRMLADEPEHVVTLLHVPLRGLLGRDQSAALYDRARGILAGCGIAGERIRELAPDGGDPAGVILGQAREGGYAVVATGCTAGGGMLRRLFRGSVVRALLARLSGAVLWVGP